MRFYKENGVNPAASCLPIVAQIPVFIGLFFVLRDCGGGDLPELPPRRPRVAEPRQHHRADEGRLGPAAGRDLQRQPAHLDVLHVDDHAGRPARDAARAADRVRSLRPQLPVRADDLLADDEPLDDGAGAHHSTADAEGTAAAAETLVANAAEGRRVGQRGEGEAGNPRRRPPPRRSQVRRVRRKKKARR